MNFSLLDRVSLLFSRFFADQIQLQPIHRQLEDVNWRLGQYDGNIRALFPPRITSDMVFSSSVDVLVRDILTNWETAEHSRLSSRLLQILRAAPVFKVVHNFLASVDEIIANVENFIDCLSHVWFTQTAADLLQYPRGPKTCGFQHVFIGERKRTVKGLHSWQRLFILERQGHLITRRIIKRSPDFHLAALSFEWDETPKPYGTIFFGLPMDFEMMLFFVAFMMTKNQPITFMLVGRPVTIETYDLALIENAMSTAFFKY
ncbi:unnamed protein product [Schistocephalus solidus]|uniref:Uridylate-specific endoribonuclease n=1 Tax=Schistocephalus solidus TaxID=70667 RepID=A0A183STU2_SCHSO|nr:unnamed protein product [Schistocephalus solidus]